MGESLIVPQNPVFDTEGDELACGFTGCRNKSIHAKGNVAKFKWVDQGGHKYTGMFKGGTDYGIVRFSVAAPAITASIAPKLLPGMGVKLLRDHHDSANFVAMYSVDGQTSLNYF